MPVKTPPPLFTRLGSIPPASPVVIAATHAGRYYPPELLDNAVPSKAQLQALEDRCADLLVTQAVDEGASALVAHYARAWVDLNRDPRELDPAMLSPSPPAHELLGTAKVRSGLGVIPRRLGSGATIPRGPIALVEARARLRDAHEPFHVELSAMLQHARATHGQAILLDCHSMPPLPTSTPGAPAQVVIGDLHGRGADARFVTRAAEAVESAGLRLARNSPYAGAYTLRRHGQPAHGIHALQVEIDRSLYLHPGLDAPSEEGVRAIGALVAAIADALRDEISRSGLPIAAE